MKIADLRRFLAPLARRVDNMVARGVVKVVKDSSTMQAIQAELLKGEVRDNIERFQEYGFTSVPHEGAEAVVVFSGGDRSHGLAIAVDDRRYRKKDMQTGEVALYTDEGDYILLKRGRVIKVVAGAKLDVNAPEVVLTATTKVKMDTPLVECTQHMTIAGLLTAGSLSMGAGGTADINGQINANGGLAVTGTLTNNGTDVGSGHRHDGVQTGTGTSGTPI